MSKNAIHIIQPYWTGGTWAFDDASVGLHREPFVCGIPKIIDRLVADISNARSGFRLLFSEHEFPNYQLCLDWVSAEGSGNWYKSGNNRGWLCPALFCYYECAPKKIFVKVESL